jgi:nucleoid DNA-binding protein
MTTKKMLARRMSTSTGLDIDQAERMLEAALSAVVETLAEGDNIEIRGFGSFKVVKEKEKIGFNPSMMEKVLIPAANRVRFKLSKHVTVGEPQQPRVRFIRKKAAIA